MKKKVSKKNFNHLFYILLCIVVVLLGSTPLKNIIRYPFSYVFSPVYTYASEVGESVLSWSDALVNASSYIEEYNSMKNEIVRLKIENAEKILDYNDYKALKEHSSLFSNESTYVESKVVRYTDKGELIINKGLESGIAKGDIVTLGRVFVGTIIDVNSNSSLVRLPINNSSSYEVVVIPSTVNLNEEKSIDSFIKSSGVVTGELDSIRIENIGINSTAGDSDTVLIRDERIGEILILGTLVGVSQNPASTHKSGVVSPIFDYSNILNVFVRIE